MAYVPTILTGSVGIGSAVKPALNKPDDVRKVTSLLRKATGLLAPPLRDEICDTAMQKAIADFQRLWGTSADGTVDPGGLTLKRLERLANPLILKPITKGRVANGGYMISYSTCDGGPLPAAGKGYTLHLCVRDEAHRIDVTGQRASDLLTKDNLGALLTILDTFGCWAAPVSCKLQLRWRDTPVSTSDPQTFIAPVQPHNGKMLPLDEKNNGAKLTYQGDAVAKVFRGRMFAEVAGYSKRVFVWAGEFETDPNYRGFDCITYAGTTCGASNQHMADSADLAASLGATAVDHTRKVKDPTTGKDVTETVKLDGATPAYIKEYLAGATTGYYLLWSGGHIVLVVDGEVHEFKASEPAGYTRTAVSQWLEPYEKSRLTLRKLPGKPARAA
jgi:hypothetical protein